MGWVMFDYGGVISHPQPEDAVEELAELAGCSRASLEGAYWAHRLDYDRADLDGRAFWQKIAAALGLVLSERQIAELIVLDTQSWLHVRADTADLIEEAAAGGHRLALLSNAPTEVAAAVAALPVAGSFEHLAFSCDLRSVKPDPDCYQAVLVAMGAVPEEVVFLDDRPENVAGAEAVGMCGVRFTGAAQAREALAWHGVLPG